MTDALSFKNKAVIDLEHVSIIGERIKLVSISDDFADDIFREFTSEITTYMIPSPPKEMSETKAFISKSVEEMKQQKELVLAITSLAGEFLGCVGLHGRGAYRTPELGIWLKKSAHGEKFGQEAINQLLNWARQYIDFDYAIYPVDKSNIASRKIPESLGGVFWKEAQVKTFSGDILDEVVYKISS